MSDIDMAALRAAAEGATPGPWRAVGDEYGDEWWFGGLNDGGQVTVGRFDGTHHIVTDAGHGADMEYIAAANPAVVLELLDRLAAAEGAVARVRDICELDAGRRRVCVYDPDCQCEFKDCYECGKWHNCIHSPLTAVREALDPKEQP